MVFGKSHTPSRNNRRMTAASNERYFCYYQVEDLRPSLAAKMVPLYEQMLEEALHFITAVGRSMSQTTEATNYWHSLLSKAYEILDKVLFK